MSKEEKKNEAILFQNSQTYENLLYAFVEKSQARNRFSYFSSVAKRSGYEQIASLWDWYSNQEKEHGKVLYQYFLDKLDDNSLKHKVEASFPVFMGSTEENLRFAAEVEEAFSEELHNFSHVAKEEGYDDLARIFRNFATIDRERSKRFSSFAEQLASKALFEKEEVVDWSCRVCGYIHTSKKAPEVCPTCRHPKAFFQVL